MAYAGQKKVFNEIDKKVKREKSRKKSNAKKAKEKKIQYYNKLLNKPKPMKDQLQKLIDKYKVELAVEKQKLERAVDQAVCSDTLRAKNNIKIYESFISDLTKLLEENK